MSDLILNKNQIVEFDFLNCFFEENRNIFNNILKIDNIINEAHVLTTIESNIPRDLFFDLHLDMILSENKHSLTDYYKSMAPGSNYILEAARKIFPNNTIITESIESFKEYLGILFEESVALGIPGENVARNIDSAFTGGELRPRTSEGFWSTLKNLWLAITEGGSLIGVIHFIIDIIGLVGDFIFPGVGVCADLLNAGIYALRGEWMLCAISTIAAVVIGAGDALKLLKFAAKPAEKVMIACAKGETKQAGEMLAKMSTKEKGGVLKLLTQIFGSIGSALGKATSLIGKLVESFGKITKWIPGLGLLLKPVFDMIGNALTKFGEKMTLASANFKLVTKSAKETASLTIDAAIKSGGDFVVDGPWIKVFNKEGKQIGKYPASLIDKLTTKELRDLTVKKAGSPEAAQILYKNGGDIAKTEKFLTDPKTQESLRKRAFDYFNTTPLKKFTTRAKKDFIFFIGKQIYKYVFGKEWVSGGNNKWSSSEIEGHGNGAINSWIDSQIKDKKNKTGATYIPEIILDSRDKETYNKIKDYQNHFANILGEPNIMQEVVTKKYDTEGEASEFKDFFAEIAKGNIKRGGPGDTVSHGTIDEIGESQSSAFNLKFKTILSFSDFNK